MLVVCATVAQDVLDGEAQRWCYRNTSDGEYQVTEIWHFSRPSGSVRCRARSALTAWRMVHGERSTRGRDAHHPDADPAHRAVVAECPVHHRRAALIFHTVRAESSDRNGEKSERDQEANQYESERMYLLEV